MEFLNEIAEEVRDDGVTKSEGTGAFGGCTDS